MPTHRKLFFVAAALLVLGIASFLLQPGGPDTECATPGGPTSGFYDQEKGCPVSSESMREVADYNSSPKIFRIAGVVLVVAGAGVGIAGLVSMSRSGRKSGDTVR
ncbi:hypothetical protein [Amycolatopsis suaedae]|uniref:Uncharacterized protein n=1 Tax=Amycolatopsis suaedae TaxID=2510978 RepID=A0A4Q7JAL7_9PSEU|nr:hypothetical protein [Amycolatopsis suaedae]RZQ63244.1 hypothetical protein EWH70_16390 [Amycolatopsis suaedae]